MSFLPRYASWGVKSLNSNPLQQNKQLQRSNTVAKYVQDDATEFTYTEIEINLNYEGLKRLYPVPIRVNLWFSTSA